MRVMKVAQDRYIVLPKRLFRLDDTVVIKKVGPRLSLIAQRVRGRVFSLRAITREVRAYRKVDLVMRTVEN